MNTTTTTDGFVAASEKEPGAKSLTEIPSQIPRKPVPVSITTYSAPSAVPVTYSKPPRPLLARLRTRWSLLQRRTRIIILTSLFAFIVLIVGLAAGLSAGAHKGPSNLPLPTNTGGPFSGDLTYYGPGLGACGVTSTNSDRIVAVSHYIFDAVSVGSNPNANPLCGQKIRARRDGKSVDLTVVDRCVGCQPKDLDVTVDTFAMLADVDLGRVNVEWAWLEQGVPGAAGGG